MASQHEINPVRRGFITATGLLTGAVLSGKLDFLSTKQSADNFDATLDQLLSSLNPTQYRQVVRPWNDPTRQITNTVAVHKVPHIGTLFSLEQQQLIRVLYQHMLSRQGQQWMHKRTTKQGLFCYTKRGRDSGFIGFTVRRLQLLSRRVNKSTKHKPKYALSLCSGLAH